MGEVEESGWHRTERKEGGEVFTTKTTINYLGTYLSR
jgi:hypothetical protein